MDEEERKERKEQRQKQRVRQLIFTLFTSYFRVRQLIFTVFTSYFRVRQLIFTVFISYFRVKQLILCVYMTTKFLPQATYFYGVYGSSYFRFRQHFLFCLRNLIFSIRLVRREYFWLANLQRTSILLYSQIFERYGNNTVNYGVGYKLSFRKRKRFLIVPSFKQVLILLWTVNTRLSHDNWLHFNALVTYTVGYSDFDVFKKMGFTVYRRKK